MVLYAKKPEDTLSKDVELQLKILFNMHDNNLNEQK